MTEKQKQPARKTTTNRHTDIERVKQRERETKSAVIESMVIGQDGSVENINSKQMMQCGEIVLAKK